MAGKYEDRSASRRQQQRLIVILAGVLLALLVLILILFAVLRQNTPDTPTTPSTPSSPSSSSVPTDSQGETLPPMKLTMVTPEDTAFSTVEDTCLFSGRSDPKQVLTINGQTVERDGEGMFTCAMPLTEGENVFTLVYGEETHTYTVTRLSLIRSCFPAGNKTYCSEAPILLEVAAKTGSTVTAALNGETVTLQPSADQLGSGAGEGFTLYEGRFQLPTLSEDQDFGRITYTVSCDGKEETLSSGSISGKAAVPVLESDPGVTPSGGEYIDVGSGLILEVVSRTAETFDGRTDDDNSNPTRNYLPKGTVDYCSSVIVKNDAAKQTYRIMRCGRRTYEAKRNPPASQRDPISVVYNGTLPDHNEIGFASLTESGNGTILTLDTMWKAPFYFDMAPQSYANPARRDFTVSEVTISYLDITFCYATKFTGEVAIPENHPLFASAEVVQNQSDCTLRLHLRQAGGFYGWDAYYNEKDQLCFRFLKPAQVTEADNAYGADLTGVTVMLDVGHGGVDGGAVGKTGGQSYTEAERNLALAKALRNELESMGATVVMNRTGNEPVTVEERLAYLKEVSPDLCIAVHQNSSTSAAASGFEVFYFGVAGHKPAYEILQTHKQSDVYTSAILKWHYYHLARQSNCPIVLTENGYMSNDYDMEQIAGSTEEKAKLIAQGVANYFLSLRQ